MNAPENTPPPINRAHEVLMKSDSAMCVEDVARAIVGKNPTKADIKTVAKLLKEIADLGLIEMEPRAGGVPFYRLITAPTPEVCDSVQTEGSKQTEALEPERVLTPEAEAERDQFEAEYGHGGNCSCHISPPCPSCMHPGNPINQEEDETAWMAAPAEDQGKPLNFGTSPELQYLAPEDYEMPPADPQLLAMANRELSLQLSHIAATCADYLPDPSDITTARAVEIMDMLIDAQRGQIESLSAELPAKDYELVMQARRAIELGVKIDEQDQSIDSLTKDVINTRAALNKAINEADRLRAELAAERQAREALQEQDDAVDVTDAAVGYLIRAPKRKPRLVSKPERARDAALAAVRAGAGRAEVLAMVPVGVARRGAEWQESGPRANGD